MKQTFGRESYRIEPEAREEAEPRHSPVSMFVTPWTFDFCEFNLLIAAWRPPGTQSSILDWNRDNVASVSWIANGALDLQLNSAGTNHNYFKTNYVTCGFCLCKPVLLSCVRSTLLIWVYSSPPRWQSLGSQINAFSGFLASSSWWTRRIPGDERGAFWYLTCSWEGSGVCVLPAKDIELMTAG